MVEHAPHPARSREQIAAVDAVNTLSCTLDAFIALEELLEAPAGENVSQQISRDKIGTLLGVLNTRMFLDLRDAEAAVVLAFHHCADSR